MARNPIVTFIDRQQWIGRVADLLAPAVGRAFAAAGTGGRRLKALLNGVWLGHPLHTALTDIPLGAWTSAFVFDLGGAVTRDVRLERAARFTPVLHERELKDGRPIRAHVGDVPVVLVRTGQQIHALVDTCAHLGGPLSEGRVEQGATECPWHGSTFSLDDGRVLKGPATHPQPVFETRIRGGQVEIRLARRGRLAPVEAQVEGQRRAAS